MALTATPAAAQEKPADKIKAVASISIIGDLVRNVGGDRIDVATLVGPNGDAHVYSPTPGDAKKLASAAIVFVNGLGLEGWISRLVSASATKDSIVTRTVSEGIAALKDQNTRDGDRSAINPHAWQSVANAKIYVANIRDALRAVDPADAAAYDANACQPIWAGSTRWKVRSRPRSARFQPPAARSSSLMMHSAISAQPMA